MTYLFVIEWQWIDETAINKTFINQFIQDNMVSQGVTDILYTL